MRVATQIRPIYFAIFFLTCALTDACFVSHTSAAEFMFRARVDGKMVEGQPIVYDKSLILLMGRNGAVYEFAPKDAKEARKTGPRFYGYEMREMKRELYEEFGDRFDISTTRHYIVVHPRGQRSLWTQRFEDLYRSFIHYFRVRGFRPEEPKFPLAAIVFRNKAEYYAHAEKGGQSLPPGYLGHYDSESNRVMLFDITGGKENAEWSENADTIIHEATHQTAYNVGVHTRYSGSPRWMVEGLATMFEAKGVWDSRSYQNRGDRLNPGRLHDFKKYAKTRRKPGALQRMIASDRIFKSDMNAAYAEAWAFSFYLCETQPRKYSDYLALTADRKMFTTYSAGQRVADFASIFGNEWKMLEVKFLRFMEEL